MAITLPELCGTRERAQLLLEKNFDRAPLFDLTAVKSTAQGFVDELCSVLMAQRVDEAQFRGASESFKRHFMRSHFLRGAKFTPRFF